MSYNRLFIDMYLNFKNIECEILTHELVKKCNKVFVLYNKKVIFIVVI